MNYKEYKNARDTAWKILIDLKVCELPLQIKSVCHKLGIRVQSYQAAMPAIQTLGLGRLTRQTDGFAIRIEDVPVI